MSLVNFMGVKPRSIGEGWMVINLETSWEEALKYMQEMSAEKVVSGSGMKHCISRLRAR